MVVAKPETWKNNPNKIKAYQCEICDTLDVDDISDKVFCRCGFYPGCGDPDGCREAFKPIVDGGRIGVHR